MPQVVRHKGADGDGTLRLWLVLGLLGSSLTTSEILSVTETDASGTTTVRTFGQLPFGETWYETGTTSKWKFTSYEADAESSLNYAKMRYQSQRLGRFMTPDLLSGSIYTPQSLNKYNYANSDPVNFTDPTGLWSEATCVIVGIPGCGGGGFDTWGGSYYGYANAGFGDYLASIANPGFNNPSAISGANDVSFRPSSFIGTSMALNGDCTADACVFDTVPPIDTLDAILAISDANDRTNFLGTNGGIAFRKDSGAIKSRLSEYLKNADCAKHFGNASIAQHALDLTNYVDYDNSTVTSSNNEDVVHSSFSTPLATTYYNPPNALGPTMDVTAVVTTIFGRNFDRLPQFGQDQLLLHELHHAVGYSGADIDGPGGAKIEADIQALTKDCLGGGKK